MSIDPARARLARALFRPPRVAIVGASADVAKNSARPQRYLRRHGYAGEVCPVNPNYGQLFGEPCYPSIAAAPHPVDHAYLMVPARAVENVIRECGAAGVAVATIFSGGFAEAGEAGRARQDRIVAVAREAGVRLVGPNSLGVINTHHRMALSANAVLERDSVPCGSIGLVSQSGSMIGALISRGQTRGIHFSTLVSVGNEADLGVGEVADLLVDDPHTDTIVLFLETLRRAGDVRAMAARATAAGKPVLAYVLGRSEVGQALAQSHTGALLGQRRALDAFLDAAGIMRLGLFESLLEAPALVRGRRPAAGRRVAIATTSGGAAALVADPLGERGIELVPPGPALVGRLAGLGVEVHPSPIVDLTMAGTRPEVVDAVIGAFVDDPRVDAVVMAVGSSSEFRPELAVRPLVRWAQAGKPVVSFMLPDAARSLSLLAEAGIAGFRTPEACADALDAYLSWQMPRPVAASALPAPALALLARFTPGTRLHERDALELFAALGVEVPGLRVLAAPAEAHGVDLPFPVVAKVLSPDIAHKTEVGGVVRDIGSAAALEAAASRILASVRERAPGARIAGIVVQAQHAGLMEAIVGFRRDPRVGPVVVVGAGGTLAELYADVAVRPAPVDDDEAMRMLAEVRAFALLRGYRGTDPGDLDALATIVARVSQLAAADAIAEAELNPVLVRRRGEGAVAVDALLVCADIATGPGA